MSSEISTVLNSEHLFLIMLFVVLFGFVLINMIVLGFMLKLYTEIFKERAFASRAKEPGPFVRELLRPVSNDRKPTRAEEEEGRRKAATCRAYSAFIRHHCQNMDPLVQGMMFKAADMLDELSVAVLNAKDGPVVVTNFELLPPEVVVARQTKATEWQIHAGNVRQHGRFMASRPDQETMHNAAAALDDAAGFLLSTTNARLANTWPAVSIFSHPPA